MLKLAQAYNTEKLRNTEYEKALKNAHIDLANMKVVEDELKATERTHKEKAENLLKMQEQVKKNDSYRETVKKQEVVIAKLEHILEKVMGDNQKAVDGAAELEKLKIDIKGLQGQVQAASFGPNLENSELERIRREV